MIGFTDASVSFGSRTLFSGITFNVPVGRTMAVLGPNGRGKTTLLRALLGFQPLAKGARTAPKIAGYVPPGGSALLPDVRRATADDFDFQRARLWFC